jgi:Na+-transporting NADH:ubiquinone oxidoreductase subunit F
MVYVLSILVLGGLLAGLAVLLSVAESYLLDYGICIIDINSGERPIQVEGGRTLLSSLYDNQIFIPSACGGKGSCGHCKITVTSGGGPVLPTERPYLSRWEIRSAVRLACQVKVRQDMSVRIAEEYLNIKLFTAIVENTRELTYDIKEIRLSLQEPSEISYLPGQYVQVQAPSPEGPVFRAYSISSATYMPSVVELVVRLVPGGIASTYLHNLSVGNEVIFTGPYGEFRLNENPSIELVCVGGGCGMAPIRNIIYDLYKRWPDRSCRLFFGCRTRRDVFYLEQFEQLQQKHPNFQVVYALSEAHGDKQWTGERGFIHLAVDKYLEAGPKRQAFLCGPPLMIQAVTTVLKEKGVDPEEVFYDEF